MQLASLVASQHSLRDLAPCWIVWAFFLHVYDEIAKIYKDDAAGLAESMRRSNEGVSLDLLDVFHTILRVFYNVDDSKEDQKF